MNGGGLAFFAETDLSIDDEAEIAFTEYEDLTLRGVVRNRAGHQHGVKFVATSAEEAEKLGLFRKNLRGRMGTPGRLAILEWTKRTDHPLQAQPNLLWIRAPEGSTRLCKSHKLSFG